MKVYKFITVSLTIFLLVFSTMVAAQTVNACMKNKCKIQCQTKLANMKHAGQTIEYYLDDISPNMFECKCRILQVGRFQSAERHFMMPLNGNCR